MSRCGRGKQTEADLDRPRNATIRNSSNELASVTAQALFDTEATAAPSLPTSLHEEAARWKRSFSIASTGCNRPEAVGRISRKRSFNVLPHDHPLAGTRSNASTLARNMCLASGISTQPSDMSSFCSQNFWLLRRFLFFIFLVRHKQPLDHIHARCKPCDNYGQKSPQDKIQVPPYKIQSHARRNPCQQKSKTPDAISLILRSGHLWRRRPRVTEDLQHHPSPLSLIPKRWLNRRLDNYKTNPYPVTNDPFISAPTERLIMAVAGRLVGLQLLLTFGTGYCLENHFIARDHKKRR